MSPFAYCVGIFVCLAAAGVLAASIVAIQTCDRCNDYLDAEDTYDTDFPLTGSAARGPGITGPDGAPPEKRDRPLPLSVPSASEPPQAQSAIPATTPTQATP